MATRNFVQKEAGTITYQLREKHDLRGESNADNPALAVSVVGGRTVTAEELAKEIAASCTIKEADVAGVLTALSHVNHRCTHRSRQTTRHWPPQQPPLHSHRRPLRKMTQTITTNNGDR